MAKDDPTCSTCGYFQTNLPDTPDVFGICHRNPPQVIAGPGGPVTAFPVLRVDHWCGEHDVFPQRPFVAPAPVEPTAADILLAGVPQAIQQGIIAERPTNGGAQ